MLVTTEGNKIKLNPTISNDAALTAETKRALTNAIRPESIFEHLDKLNEEIEETYQEELNTPEVTKIKTPVVPVKRVLNKKQEPKQQLNRIEKKMDLEKELDQIVEKAEIPAEKVSDKDQVLELLSKLPDAPSIKLINNWRAEHGELHVTVFSDKEIYVYSHLTRAMWAKVQDTVQKLQSVKNTVGEEELRETVVKHCMKWPALTTEWKYTSRAGVVDALYQAIMLHSYFLTPQQVMAITVEI